MEYQSVFYCFNPRETEVDFPFSLDEEDSTVIKPFPWIDDMVDYFLADGKQS